MVSRRMTALSVFLVMGTLQLWDSRVFSAGAPAMAFAAVAMLAPAAALLLAARLEVKIGAVLVCAALLLAAKLVAPHPLPAIGVIALIAAAANGLAAAKPCAA